MSNTKSLLPFLLAIILGFCTSVNVQSQNKEQYRPQFHFSPLKGWMNDPNGMVFLDGEYHLFYQYFPDKTVWGPMHWGHAVSTDMIHWQHLPIALYPDSLGYIFSGSSVVDVKNSSGLGTVQNPPMIAIFTYHNAKLEKAGSKIFQNQGIAYSTDKGRTWAKYSGNPVLKNPGFPDFRDPKVNWNEPLQRWIMVLAAGDRVKFFSSSNLIDWTFESDFGVNLGAHGGVWECPDLFPMKIEGTNDLKWVLLVSINPGGPNGGSSTQYFVGDFNGHEFKNLDSHTRWIDFGKDNYAGVTWSNIPTEDGRRLFVGWMSNWEYAQKVPTILWRSAMTLPRELSLLHENNGYCLASNPVKEVLYLRDTMVNIKLKNITGNHDISKQIPFDKTQVEIIVKFKLKNKQEASKFGIKLSNRQNEQVLIGYNVVTKQYYVDRRKSGNIGFSDSFNGVFIADCEPIDDSIEMHLFIDKASVELFGQQGRIVLTNIFFPAGPYNKLSVFSEGGITDVQECKVWKLKSIL
jgi:fructan beta-fructosidase